MIALHHGGRSGHSASVLIALAEKSVDFESRPVDLAAHEQHGAAFLAINPAGQLPVLEADGQCLTETFFILQYLDERFPDPPLGGATPQARYAAQKWGKYVETHLAPNLAIVAWAARGPALALSIQAGFARLTPERRRLWEQAAQGFDAADVETARAAADKAIARAAEALAAAPWLAGGRYSIADIAVFPHMVRAQGLGFALPAPVAGWLGRVGARPRVRDAVGGIDADIVTMGPERGRWG